MRIFRYLPVLCVPLMLFTACQQRLALVQTQPFARPVIAEPIMPEGVYISPVQTGDPDAPFVQTGEFRHTFPNNQIGANLAFTSNLRMPKLEAVALGNGNYQLHMRFSNATREPLLVSLACIYEGETRAGRVIRAVEFPVNTFRDIVMEMTGDPGRKLNIHANAVPSP